MMIRTASLAAAASLLSLVGTAHAAELLSSPLWTDTGNGAICNIRNVSTTPIAIQVKLFSNDTSRIDIDTCNVPSAPLGPGKTCSVFSSRLPDDSFVECSVKTSDVNASRLRASIEVRRFADPFDVPPHNGPVVVGGDLR